MERQEIDDEQEEHTIGSLDTSMDRYLEHHRLWRKRIPQDGSSLFRAVSEDLFSTQVHHYDVRLKCIEHMEMNANEYSPLITMSLSKYLTHLKDPTTPGGMLEVEALARCYRIRIIVYSGKDHDPVECHYGSKKIMLSLIGYQFDRVITEERRRLLGIVQAYVYKFLYSDVFNQPKVVEQAKIMLRKSDTLYYGIKGICMQKSTRTEKKINHDLIPVPYRTAKAFEPAIYRNVAYDVYMNDHFKKYFDKNLLKQHPHIPFMTHNRLIERFGVKMHLPVTYINPPDCRRVIVTLSNSDELFAYYVGEDVNTNMHNVYLVKFGSMTKTTGEKMLDFPASLGRRPVTFAQLKRNTNIFRKLKPCLDASLQFFEERSSRRQKQQGIDYGNNQPLPFFRPYPPLMSPINPTVLCSPQIEHYPPNPNWNSPIPSSYLSSSQSAMSMYNADQMQLHHRLSVNVTDHYEWTTNPTNYYPGYPTPGNGSNLETMSLNGSLSSNTSTNDSSSFPILAPIPTVFLNQYPQQSSNEQTYVSPTMFFPQQISPRILTEQTQTNMMNDLSSNKFLSNQTPFILMQPPPPPPPSQPVSGFHPITMLPRVYMNPMNCSPNGYVPHEQLPVLPPPPLQSSPTFPILYSSSSPTSLPPWIPTGASPGQTLPPPPPPPPPVSYFMLPNHQQVQSFPPFQQFI